jgi:hypothetical protein
MANAMLTDGRALSSCFILRLLFERWGVWLASKVFLRSRC